MKAGGRITALLAASMALGLVAVAPAAASGATAELERRQTESREEYERIVREASLSRERLAELEAEIDALRRDAATMTAALIQAAKSEKKLADDIRAIEERLSALHAEQSGLRGSLSERRDVLAEVLGALQRMGLNPPPAILVSPEDALASVRSAILLGAVVPGLKAETEALVADLQALSRVTASIGSERERLVEAATEQASEKRRLSLLLERRREIQAERETALASETERAAALARQSASLEELIASLETEIDSVRQSIEEARAREAERRRREAESAQRPIPEANRLVGAGDFQSLAGMLALPVSGRLSRRFGEEDGLGGRMQGDMVATQSTAIVTAPADGSVLYAGPFRSYGQLLILNAGGGYHVVLAGMGRIDVALGQAVLAGEPVGAMGEARLASVAGFVEGNVGPELYIEFRKDGKPVDPATWWAEGSSGRTGNGT